MPGEAELRALAMLTQYNTMFSGGVAPQRAQMLDLQNVPGMNSQLGLVLSSALQTILMQTTNNMGFAGLQFSGTQSIYDRMQAQDFFLESRKAIQAASMRDQGVYMQQLLGAARLAGTNIGENQIRAARMMASDIAQMGTVFGDMMPDLFDEMHGIRGSNMVMARKIHLGGRYAFDPYTGELGMRGETAGQISSTIYDQMFGPGADLRNMRGFGAGRVGQLYDELQRRGFLGGAATNRYEGLRRAASAAGLDTQKYAAGQLEELGLVEPDATKAIDRYLGTSEGKAEVIKTEANRIQQRLKSMIGAVSAMRDIFGDMGKPNAPMAELINGLQALTQGGMSSIEGKDLEKIVRTTHMLSRLSGITIEGMNQLMARGAGMADQMGLDRKYAIGSMQGAAAFATAFGAVGGGNVPGWKMPDKDTIMSIDQTLRLSGARSDIANQFNATLRLSEELGLKPGTEFAAMAAAIKSGNYKYQFGGETRSVVKDYLTWQKLATEAGIPADMANVIRSQIIANQEYGAKFNTGDLARLTQRDVDINPMLQISGELAFRSLAGGDTIKSTALAARAVELLWGQDASGKAIEGGLTAATRADPAKRYAALVAGLRESVKAQGITASDDQIKQAAVRMWTDFEERVGTYEPLRGYGGALGVFAAHDPHTLQMAQQNLARAADRGQLAGALSGIGRTGVLRRFMDMLETSDGKTGFMEIVGKVFAGGIKSSEMFNALANLDTTYREYLAAPADTEAGRERRAEIAVRLQEIATRAASAASREGYSLGGIGAEDTKNAAQFAANMMSYAGTSPRAAQTAATSFMDRAKAISSGLVWNDDKLKLIGAEGWSIVKESRERWSKLRAMADRYGVSMEELLSGTGKAEEIYKKDPSIKAEVDKERAGLDKLGELLSGTEKHDMSGLSKEIEAERKKYMLLNDPKELASAVMTAVGRSSETASPRLMAKLQDPENRTRMASMLEAFSKVKTLISGKGLDPASAEHQEAIKKLIGEADYKTVEPLLKALGTGKLDEMLGAAKDTTEKREVVLGGPLKIEGEVSIKDSSFVFTDVSARGHVPLEDGRGKYA